MTNQSLTIVSWNINGIRAAEKKGFLTWLHSTRPDIVALQETRAAQEQVSSALQQPSDYHTDWCAAERKGYSGVATFSRVPPLTVSRGLDDPRFDRDGRVLVSVFSEFVFFNIYFPNGGRGPEWVAHKLDFYVRFLEVVGEVRAAGKEVIVAGDVNTAFAEIDLARPRENVRTSGFMPEERAGMEAFFRAGLVDTFRSVRPQEVKYSWWSMQSGARERNVGWRLDYIFVSPNLRERIIDADIHCEITGSDHCPVSLTLAMS